MSLNIERYCDGFLGANSYIAECDGHFMAVDVGWPEGKAMDRLRELGSKVELIVATHRHFDHVMGIAEAKRATGATVAIHRLDACGLQSGADSMYNRYRRMLRRENETLSPDRPLEDGDSISLGSVKFTVMNTPGHTEGSICLYGGGVLFSGDTLFEGTIGRTDFPTGDAKAMLSSLERLCELPDDTAVYAGHGATTTVGRERLHNPYMQGEIY